MPEIDPHIELHINEKLQEHRKTSNESYAAKIVEKVVFYVLGAVGIAVLGAILKLIIL